ncbi:MAG: flagellar hook-basal body complex protein, partial [Elusimicrobiota bacterium]
MSLRALVTGVAGLKSYTEGLDVIGNNVANVDTTAYKSSRVTYKEVFTQTLKQATRLSNPQQIGLGVKVGSIDVNHKQGALKSTGRDTDMAIEGDGFFVLQNPMDATENYFSRDG